jgi:C4-dicarboxylate-specific signal transduction histidine kinase
MRQVLDTGETLAVETVRRNRSGTPVPVSLLCVPVASSVGGDAGYLIYRDITVTKRLQDEQRRYHELELELAHASRIATLGQLSASIAHELNQPLTGVITNCRTCLRMLTAGPGNPDAAREVVRRTLRDGERAVAIVARLRALFTKKEPATEPVDLNEATREVIALSLGELEKDGVLLRTELSDELPLVAGDRIQLQQVVLNLIRNALDAMSTVDDRRRELLIRTHCDDAGGVRLSVTDAGVGFDPLTANRLFEAFYTTKADGMGVGLSVSRSIVENHGGSLSAILNDGPGATFSFAVPAYAAR